MSNILAIHLPLIEDGRILARKGKILRMFLFFLLTSMGRGPKEPIKHAVKGILINIIKLDFFMVWIIDVPPHKHSDASSLLLIHSFCNAGYFTAIINAAHRRIF